MLRIILWRLTFEALSLLKVLGYRGRDSKYFAYGGNLDPEVLKKRAITVKAKEQAIAEGFLLRFNHEVPFEGIAMASISPAKISDSVPGLLYTIPKIDELRMDCFEANFFFIDI